MEVAAQDRDWRWGALPSEPLGTVSALEAVAARLRDKILDGELEPLTEITEAEVAGSYGVSRPTAKGAIVSLVSDGLLRRAANKPAYVPKLSADDLRDLFFVRVPLELQMVRRIIDLRLEPQGAEAAVHDLGRMGDNVPPSRFVEADLRFHRSLADSIGSPRFSRLYRAIQGELHLSMVQSKPARGAELISSEHGGILEAIREADRKKAVNLMESHLERTIEAITGHRAPSGA